MDSAFDASCERTGVLCRTFRISRQCAPMKVYSIDLLSMKASYDIDQLIELEDIILDVSDLRS